MYRKILFTLALLELSLVVKANPSREFMGNFTADTYDWQRHPCRRLCDYDAQPQECYYIFIIEQYRTMSKACYNCPAVTDDCFRPHCIPADGKERTLHVINRQMPGPNIEVCKGDTIVVDVINEMFAESTTIHWHGINQQTTPYMDGVPYVTQCPIGPGQSFRYTFPALDSGTYFYHSHVGNQLNDGLLGSLIIRERWETNFMRYLYDQDYHTIILTDWLETSGFADMIRNLHNRNVNVPMSLLINGKGMFIDTPRPEYSANMTPIEIFNVEPNQRYRFRLINAGGENCPMEFSIDDHKLLVISLDSNDIEPVEVDVITTWTGERVDFVITTDQNPSNYWIRIRGHGLCRNNNRSIYQFAFLQYGSSSDWPTGPFEYREPDSNARVLNPFQKGTETVSESNVQLPSLRSLKQYERSLLNDVDQQIFITFDAYPLDNKVSHRRYLYGYYQVPQDYQFALSQLNHISMKMQPFPLLSQRYMVKPSLFCNNKTVHESNMNCEVEHCTCTHVIEIDLYNTVELVLIDEGFLFTIDHPIHLHGHYFHVVGTENFDRPFSIDQFQRLDREGKIKRKLQSEHPPLKDTIKTPGSGYTIIRFIADNPGYWLLHCHVDPHLLLGMSLVFKVGNHYEMPPVPASFPKCGNY